MMQIPDTYTHTGTHTHSDGGRDDDDDDTVADSYSASVTHSISFGRRRRPCVDGHDDDDARC